MFFQYDNGSPVAKKLIFDLDVNMTQDIKVKAKNPENDFINLMKMAKPENTLSKPSLVFFF